MVNKFDEFRDKYLEYVEVYNGYKILLQMTQKSNRKQVQMDTSNCIQKLAELQSETGLLAKKLMAQLQDTFADPREKKAYLGSIKTFLSNELDKWYSREPEQKRQEWQQDDPPGRIYRDWMPNHLYDILREIRRVEGPGAPQMGIGGQGAGRIETLLDIFHNSYDYDTSIAALRHVKIIDAKNNYLLGPRQKSVFAAWLAIVGIEKKQTRPVSRAILVGLLNKEFHGLELGADTPSIENVSTTAAKTFKARLNAAF